MIDLLTFIMSYVNVDGMKRKRFTLDLADKNIEAWREIAKSHGYTIGRGPRAAEGSIQGMMDAVFDGRLTMTIEVSQDESPDL